jgi:sugar-specific transcriptional regulator TrmB
MDIGDSLAKLGIGGTEARFYLAALEFGQAPVRQIARKAGIGRTNAYDVLSRLVDRGLVTQAPRSGDRKNHVVAEDPSRLVRMLEEQRQSLDAVLPDLRLIYNNSTVKPRVRFYEGVEGIKRVLDETLTCRSKRLLGVLSMGDLFNVPGRAAMQDYVQRRIAAGVALKVLRSREKDVGDIWPTRAEDLRQLRYAPAGMVFTMTMYIYDDTVSVISSRRENFGMTIQSAELAGMQEHLFMVLWDASVLT